MLGTMCCTVFVFTYVKVECVKNEMCFLLLWIVYLHQRFPRKTCWCWCWRSGKGNGCEAECGGRDVVWRVDDKAQINGDGGVFQKCKGSFLFFFTLNSLPMTRGIVGGWGKSRGNGKRKKGEGRCRRSWMRRGVCNDRAKLGKTRQERAVPLQTSVASQRIRRHEIRKKRQTREARGVGREGGE